MDKVDNCCRCEEGCRIGHLVDVSDTSDVTISEKNDWSSSAVLENWLSLENCTTGVSDENGSYKGNSSEHQTASSGQQTDTLARANCAWRSNILALSAGDSEIPASSVLADQIHTFAENDKCLQNVNRRDKLLDEEDFYFDFLTSEEFGSIQNIQRPMCEATFRRLSSLNAHEFAELFEQANTMAVRLKMAVTDEKTCKDKHEEGGDVTVNLPAVACSDSVVPVRPVVDPVSPFSFSEILTVATSENNNVTSDGTSAESATYCKRQESRVPTPKLNQPFASLGSTKPLLNTFMIRKSSLRVNDGHNRSLSNASASSCGSVSSNCSSVASQDSSIGVKPRLPRVSSMKLAPKQAVVSSSMKQRQNVSAKSKVGLMNAGSEAAAVKKLNQTSEPTGKSAAGRGGTVCESSRSKQKVIAKIVGQPVGLRVAAAAGKFAIQASKK